MSVLGRLATAASVVMLCAMAGVAHAQTPAEFYKDKTVSLLIGFGSAGKTICGRAPSPGTSAIIFPAIRPWCRKTCRAPAGCF